MTMRDMRTHLDKFFAVLPIPAIGKTATTFCGRRRRTEFLTCNPAKNTCEDCRTTGLRELYRLLDSALILAQAARYTGNDGNAAIARRAIRSLQTKIDTLSGSQEGSS